MNARDEVKLLREVLENALDLIAVLLAYTPINVDPQTAIKIKDQLKAMDADEEVGA